jgi:hypothetical protein
MSIYSWRSNTFFERSVSIGASVHRHFYIAVRRNIHIVHVIVELSECHRRGMLTPLPFIVRNVIAAGRVCPVGRTSRINNIYKGTVLVGAVAARRRRDVIAAAGTYDPSDPPLRTVPNKNRESRACSLLPFVLARLL